MVKLETLVELGIKFFFAVMVGLAVGVFFGKTSLLVFGYTLIVAGLVGLVWKFIEIRRRKK
jgi:hypothetical protein